MEKVICFLGVLLLLSCNQENVTTVSKIKVDLICIDGVFYEILEQGKFLHFTPDGKTVACLE